MTRICGRQAYLPKSLAIPLSYNPVEIPQSRGGYADMWKGVYRGREVAIKTIRIYQTSDWDQVRRVGGPQVAVFIDR
jgi:hypothetical protein